MDKSKYEREYTAFLENSRKRIRVAKVDTGKMISTLQKVLNTPNLESTDRNDIRRIISRLPPKDNLHAALTSVLVKTVLKNVNREYDESKAQGAVNRDFENVVITLEETLENLLRFSKEFKKAGIDDQLEEIQSQI